MVIELLIILSYRSSTLEGDYIAIELYPTRAITELNLTKSHQGPGQNSGKDILRLWMANHYPKLGHVYR
jgi:hypothetical protein